MKVFMALAVCIGVSVTTALAASETPWSKCLREAKVMDTNIEKGLSSLRSMMQKGSVCPKEQARALLAMKAGAAKTKELSFPEFEAAKKKVNRAQGVEVFGHVASIGGLAAQIAVDKNASLEFLNRFERFKNSKTFQGLRTNKKRRLERAALSFAQSFAASALMRLGGFGYKNRVKNQFNKTYRGQPGVSADHGTLTDL